MKNSQKSFSGDKDTPAGIYGRYFGFKERPFDLTPNPRYFYLSHSHKEALASLFFGLREKKGFIAIIGEVGTGKTTLCRSFLSKLDKSWEVGYIFNPCLTDIELLRNINDEFRIEASLESKKNLLDELNFFLLKKNRQGKQVVLIIDEAQNLEPSVLEQLRLLSNLETETEKLIQIVLIGQPELDTLLEKFELYQLNQRISVRYELEPLSEQETGDYIAHRINIAEGREVKMNPRAIKKIYRFSRGIPRLINIFADRVSSMEQLYKRCNL